MAILLSLLLGLAALLTSGAPLDFVLDGLGGTATNDPGFVGLTWPCRADDDEVCYAGWADGSLTTGP